ACEYPLLVQYLLQLSWLVLHTPPASVQSPPDELNILVRNSQNFPTQEAETRLDNNIIEINTLRSVIDIFIIIILKFNKLLKFAFPFLVYDK
ncbi:MAG: hypothetical protein DRN27_09120, partial [Thermoplasmata archaeon]